MLIHVGFILLILVSIAYAAAVMRKIESDVSQYQRDARVLEEEHQQMDVACNTLRGLLAQVGEEVARGRAEVARLAEDKAEQEAILATLEEAPKQRLFLIDKGALAQARLWEVGLVNEGGAMPAQTAMEWGAGRTYLVPGTTDRDARFRTEARFSGGAGFRIVKIDRFRRA